MIIMDSRKDFEGGFKATFFMEDYDETNKTFSWCLVIHLPMLNEENLKTECNVRD